MKIARHEGISLNEVALRLLRRGAGLPDSGALLPEVGKALDLISFDHHFAHVDGIAWVLPENA